MTRILYEFSFGIFFFSLVNLNSAYSDEFCTGEKFNVNCGANKIIIANEAYYGRMSIKSKCVKSNVMGNIGCQTDVLPFIDWLCSGRKSCSSHVPHAKMKLMNTITGACNEELQSYLEVEYDCLEARQCQNMRPTMILSSEKGNLVASSSYDCRYKIKAAQVHHRIRLTLLDYTAFRTNESWSDTTYRHSPKFLFTVSDQSTHKRYTSTMQRRSVVYISERPEIDVSIMKLAQEFGSFILQYEAIGCKRLQEDPRYSYKYEELKVSISCKDKDILATFECKGTDWFGEYPNCDSKVEEKVFDIPYGVLVSIIIAASLILGVVILVCGLIFLQWRRNKEIYKETTLRKPIGARKQQQKGGSSQNEPLYNEYSRIDYQQVAPQEVCPHRPIYYELDTSSKSDRENGCDTRVTV